MKPGKMAIYLLAVVFTLNELVLNFFVFHAGFPSLPRTLITIVVYLILFFIASKHIGWARWTLIILLALYGATFFLGQVKALYYGIGFYYLFMSILVYWPTPIRDPDVIAVSQRNKDFVFLYSTSKFAIIGIFIPGFTAFLILGLLKGIQTVDVDCPTSWEILWEITTVGAIILPFIFFGLQYWKYSSPLVLTTTAITLFNITEYTLIQFALVRMFTTGHTLCYGSGGQNGIELSFTGWMSLPVLALLSFAFDHLREGSNTAEPK